MFNVIRNRFSNQLPHHIMLFCCVCDCLCYSRDDVDQESFFILSIKLNKFVFFVRMLQHGVSDCYVCAVRLDHRWIGDRNSGRHIVGASTRRGRHSEDMHHGSCVQNGWLRLLQYEFEGGATGLAIQFTGKTNSLAANIFRFISYFISTDFLARLSHSQSSLVVAISSDEQRLLSSNCIWLFRSILIEEVN